jgi:hypothetical protein
MSLAFALMTAINGSTGSSATLSYGLKGTKPRRRQPGGGKILTAPRWRRKPSETLSCKEPQHFSSLMGGGGPPGTLSCKEPQHFSSLMGGGGPPGTLSHKFRRSALVESVDVV